MPPAGPPSQDRSPTRPRYMVLLARIRDLGLRQLAVRHTDRNDQ
jgi:hypothetical protein